jgi:hypothetical protein
MEINLPSMVRCEAVFEHRLAPLAGYRPARFPYAGSSLADRSMSGTCWQTASASRAIDLRLMLSWPHSTALSVGCGTPH